MKDRIPIAQWPELFDAVCRRNALLNRMFADMAYGNLRFAFALARAKTLGDVLQLQADYWQNLFNVLQGKEFRDAFFAFGAAGSRAAAAESPRAESPRAESAEAAESARAESARAETSWAESARAFAQPSIAVSPVLVTAAAAAKIAESVAPSSAKTVKRASEPEPKRAAATRAAQSKTKSEKPQARPERHRPEPRRAPKPAARKRQAPPEAVAPGGKSEIRFGRLDDNAVRFTGKEAWRLRNGTWRKIPVAKVTEEAVALSKARFDQLFPKVPKLPAGAFKRERD